jgi:hypothetical protein
MSKLIVMAVIIASALLAWKSGVLDSYLGQLKGDPLSGIAAADETALSNASIHVEVWISPIDHYLHQMSIEMTASQFSWDVTYRFSNFQTAASSSRA